MSNEPADKPIPRARTSEHRALRRQQIVDDAFNLVDEVGPRAFSMRKLAQRLGMSPMGAYGYFDSKNALLLACYQKLYDGVDNRPVAGELWDDSIHRICGSLHDVMNAHPKVREIRDFLPSEIPPERHNKHIYLLHRDQGMPEGVFRGLYLALSLYMESFFRRETRQRAQSGGTGQSEPEALEPWVLAMRLSYDEDEFQVGVQWIINSVRSYRAPDPCDWRTPEDPADWTWEE